MQFAIIRANFDLMWDKYPARPNRSPGVNKVMDQIHQYAPEATSCCIQLSSAFNSAGLMVPRRSFWRENYKIEGNGWALGACDEVEYFLAGRFGATENIKPGRDQAAMKQYIRSRQGVLVFRDASPGQHTELWDGSRIRQRGGGSDGMDENFCFSQPRILFWEVANTDTPDQWDIPTWLQGWWYVSDGNPYWYYFDPQGTVHHVKSRPADLSIPPRTPSNSGKVQIKDKQPQVIITWNPSGGGTTVEQFAMWGNVKAMSGTSNRFGPLQATKID